MTQTPRSFRFLTSGSGMLLMCLITAFQGGIAFFWLTERLVAFIGRIIPLKGRPTIVVLIKYKYTF